MSNSILNMMFNNNTNSSVNQPIQLLVFDNESGYSFEIRNEGKLAAGIRFLYTEKVHIIALCLGRIVYDLFKNADLAESIIKAIEDNLGGYELSNDSH